MEYLLRAVMDWQPILRRLFFGWCCGSAASYFVAGQYSQIVPLLIICGFIIRLEHKEHHS